MNRTDLQIWFYFIIILHPTIHFQDTHSSVQHPMVASKCYMKGFCVHLHWFAYSFPVRVPLVYHSHRWWCRKHPRLIKEESITKGRLWGIGVHTHIISCGIARFLFPVFLPVLFPVESKASKFITITNVCYYPNF